MKKGQRAYHGQPQRCHAPNTVFSLLRQTQNFFCFSRLFFLCLLRLFELALHVLILGKPPAKSNWLTSSQKLHPKRSARLSGCTKSFCSTELSKNLRLRRATRLG